MILYTEFEEVSITYHHEHSNKVLSQTYFRLSPCCYFPSPRKSTTVKSALFLRIVDTQGNYANPQCWGR